MSIAEAIRGAERLALRELDLRGNRCGNPGATAIAKAMATLPVELTVRPFTGIRSLNLSANFLRDEVSYPPADQVEGRREAQEGGWGLNGRSFSAESNSAHQPNSHTCCDLLNPAHTPDWAIPPDSVICAFPRLTRCSFDSGCCCAG